MEFETHVKVRQEKFGSVIFETLREKVFVTNQTAAGILKMVEGHKQPQEIVNQLCKTYSGDPSVIKRDVEEFVEQLKSAGLIRKET